MSKITIGYWNIRALLAPIQYLLEISGLEYELKLYDFKGEDFTPESLADWLSEKDSLSLDFPNLPYLIDEDVRLTQSLAIMKYIARKAGLLGVSANASPAEVGKLEMIEQQVQDLRWNYIYYCVNAEVTELRFPEGFVKSIGRQVQPFSKWLQDKFFVLGDNICHVDLILYEALDVFKLMDPDCLKQFPNLEAFVNRIESLPAMAKFLKSPNRIEWPVVGILGIRKWGWKKE